jgi:hypothetical protein
MKMHDAVAPVAPVAELPQGRVEIDEGWLRLFAAPVPAAAQPPPT